jgi:type III secretory pathway component EscU
MPSGEMYAKPEKRTKHLKTTVKAGDLPKSAVVYERVLGICSNMIYFMLTPNRISIAGLTVNSHVTASCVKRAP